MKMIQIRGGRRGRVENRFPGQKLVAGGPLERGKGGFSLSRNFYGRTYVHFTRVNKIKALYKVSRVNEV